MKALLWLQTIHGLAAIPYYGLDGQWFAALASFYGAIFAAWAAGGR